MSVYGRGQLTTHTMFVLFFFGGGSVSHVDFKKKPVILEHSDPWARN